MLGAIAGDVIGSVHEYIGTKTTEFELFVPGSKFTDDTVLAVAVADCLLHQRDYVTTFREYVARYPDAGYGLRFWQWTQSGDPLPYNSFGNGSAMRVPAVAYAFDSLEDVLEEAARSAAVTHNHPEGVRGAQATAAAIFLARSGESKARMRGLLERRFGYDLRARLDDIRPHYRFDESCQRTVPAALIAFFESEGFEDALRKSISLGGDADTLACITGGVAEAHYGGVPAHISEPTLSALDDPLREVVALFRQRFAGKLSRSHGGTHP